MNRTNIEYGTHHWPLVTGCQHGADICAVSADCWARHMASRFKRDFTPALHPERLADPMPKTPSRILVSFTADIMGDWWLDSEQRGAWEYIIQEAKDIMRTHPMHSYLWLTKRPVNYALFNPWPSNAWVGMTLTGAEPPERQRAMLEALERVQGAGVYWLSYEPAIAPLAVRIPRWVNWVVVGGWSGKPPARFSNAQLMQGLLGVDAVMTDAAHCALWVKKNLRHVVRDQPNYQELPEVNHLQD